MKDPTVVRGKVFVTSMQKPSCQRENFLLTTKARGTERGCSMEEQTERPAPRWMFFSIVKVILIIFGVQTVT